MRAALADARHGLRLRRRRTLLTALGIALAAAMLSSALVVGDGLGFGFDRAARASGLPDVIVRFDPQPARLIAQRITALPDVAAFSVRDEVTNVTVTANGHASDSASVELVGAGRRGYAIVSGRQMSDSRFGEVVLERGLAQAWGVKLGDLVSVGDLSRLRVVGFSEAPDNVSYPLAVPRVYLSSSALAARFGPDPGDAVDEASIWLRDPRYVAEVLAQARATSYGLRGVRFVTRSGVRVLLDQAAGIVIDLLVALSVIALVTAGVMLAASARAEIQRRLGGIGVRRAVGAGRGYVAGAHALEALLIAVPAATVGGLLGVLATYGPSSRLLTLLNEPPPGAALIGPLAAGWAIAVAVPTLAATWPAWRASGRPAVSLLGGGELRGGRRRSPRLGIRWTGLTTLGARLVSARRARLAATVAMLGMSAGFVLLLLALASALQALETDPGALGKRYQLTAQLPPDQVRDVLRIGGVQAAAPRYETLAADSFSLGETIDVIAYPGNHTEFEAPPLTAGGRLHGPAQAEVGAGLADALGLSPGSTLALALPSGTELRLRVAGIVGSLAHDGRVAYVPAAALLRAEPSALEEIAVRLREGADPASVTAGLAAIGAAPQPVGGATATGKPLVDTLRSLLRAVAIVDGLVCVYALVQACALTVAERRRTVAVLRACGAGGPARDSARAARARTRAVGPRRELRLAPAVGRPRGDRGPGVRAGRRSGVRGAVGRSPGGPRGRRHRTGGAVSPLLTRRQALAEMAAAGSLLVAGCGVGNRSEPPAGSTLSLTWSDPVGDGVLRRSPGEPLLDRTDLGARASFTGVLATIGHITDAHVLDASSPARVTFLDRLGHPFQSTFRPQETLTSQVLDGAVRAVRRLRADVVIQGGDLIDNDQSNELQHALAALRGGRVDPGSGPRGYYGVQLASNPDPFYYRPDVDAPTYPGLLSAAVSPFASAGVGGRWYPVLGDHDVLVAGELVPTPVTRGLALGDRALWDLPPGLQLPAGASLTAGYSADGPPSPGLVNTFLAQALAGPTVRVPADPSRRELGVHEVIDGLRAGSGSGGGAGAGGGAGRTPGLSTILSTRSARAADRIDYHLDVGDKLRLIVLDLVRRGGGSGGLVDPSQPAWLAGELAGAGQRWVLVFTHQPLTSSAGGDELLALLDRHPRVVAAIAGHVHRNQIVARHSAGGGYWLITTASLIDYPQQARALRVLETEGGGVALETWMLDHIFPGRLGDISRQLSYIDAQGGRPQGFAGSRLDRNVRLYRQAPAGA